MYTPMYVREAMYTLCTSGRLVYPAMYTREASIPCYVHQGGYVHPSRYLREAMYTPLGTSGRLYTPLYTPGRLYTRYIHQGGYVHPSIPPGRLCTPLYTTMGIPTTLYICLPTPPWVYPASHRHPGYTADHGGRDGYRR